MKIILSLPLFFLLCSIIAPAQIPDEINHVSWSPMGDKICFTAKVKRSDELFVINIDGTGLKQLTDDEVRDAYPSWSPDGKKIIYGKDIKKYDPRLYIINADGTGEKRLFDDDHSDSFGTFSPDGSKLAYMSKRDKHWQLFIYNIKDKSRKHILKSNANDFNPVWSHNGNKIVFESNRTGNNQDDIFILDLISGKLKQVTVTKDYNEVYPFFSPVNDKIMFLSVKDRVSYLFIINEDGSGRKIIANKVWYASWSPDGKKIIYISYKNGLKQRSFEILNLENKKTCSFP